MYKFVGILLAAGMLWSAEASAASILQSQAQRSNPGAANAAPGGGGGFNGGGGPGGGGFNRGGGPGGGGGFRGRGPGGGPGFRGGYRGGYYPRGGSIYLGPGPYYDPFWPYGVGVGLGYGYGYGYGWPGYPTYPYSSTVVIRERQTPPDYLPPPDEAGTSPEQYWYYCSDPQGYYPYVGECNQQWQPVPVTPPGAPRAGGPPDDGAPPPSGPRDLQGPPPPR